MCHATCTFLAIPFCSFITRGFVELLLEECLSTELFLILYQPSFKHKLRNTTHFDGQLEENRPDSPVQRLISPFLSVMLMPFLFEIRTIEISYVDSVMTSSQGSLD